MYTHAYKILSWPFHVVCGVYMDLGYSQIRWLTLSEVWSVVSPQLGCEIGYKHWGGGAFIKHCEHDRLVSPKSALVVGSSLTLKQMIPLI